MLRNLKIALCLYLQLVCAEKLSVQKYNPESIGRQRRDTLAMCQRFKHEPDSLEDVPNPIFNRRGKREINVEEAKRVERIVDKLYDDLPERRHYRRKNIQKKATSPNTVIKSGRRYDFAPATIDQNIKKLGSGKHTTPYPEGSWHKKWKHGIVPFYIDSRTYDDLLSRTITKGLDYVEEVTCIRMQRLRVKPTDPDSMKKVEWLYITNPGGFRQCVHTNELAINKGVQIVTFGYDCMSPGDIAHEVMHILGFSHEHTRPDRDEHITILWDNIKPGYKKYFEIRSEDSLMNLPYDFDSVMHYPPRAFSKNGQRTILTEPGVKIGQREGLSETDIEKIGIVYGWECVDRNKQYLMTTCPGVIKTMSETSETVSKSDIDAYYKDRLWLFGVVNYKLAGNDFSPDEKANIQTVIQHISKETCIEFRDIASRPVTSKKPNFENSTDVNNMASTDAAKPDGSSSSQADNSNSDEGSYSESSSDSADAGEPSEPEVTRRHSSSILTFKRVFEAGCDCPPPGSPPGEQIVEIRDDCFNSVNDLLHLFIHLVGLDHQHKQYDRDNYLHIVWENLSSDLKEDLKDKLPAGASVGFPYDYRSVMHFPWLQIKDGRTNIMYPIWNDGWEMGHWQGLSSIDISKLNRIYEAQCADRKNQLTRQFATNKLQALRAENPFRN